MLSINEKGFILPMTLIISTIVIFFFVSQVDLLMIDQIYYKELEEKRELDNLMNMAMLDVKTQMKTGITDTKYTLSFEKGDANITVNHQASPLSNMYQVYITCIIENGQKFSLVFMYDPVSDQIYNLVEAVTE